MDNGELLILYNFPFLFVSGDSVKYIRGLCKFDAEDLFHGDPSLLDVD